ncbi:hypothetical protein BsWGS_00422 [Bradybaena similaris]
MLEMALAVQRDEVYAWLEDLFGDEPIPDFELTEATVQYLHQLMLTSRKNDHYVRLIVDELEQKTNEYYAEAQRLSSVLSKLHMVPNCLSQAGVNSVRSLAKLGTLLDIRDPSISCYLLSLQDLDDRLEQITEQRRQESQHLKQLATKTHSATLKCNDLQMSLDNMKAKDVENQATYEKRKAKCTFLFKKIKNYGKDLSKLQMKLKESGANESIFHENLVKKYEMLKSLQDKLAPMRAELQTYSSLPPDLSEVKIKIEQQKKELAELEKQVAESIDLSLL